MTRHRLGRKKPCSRIRIIFGIRMAAASHALSGRLAQARKALTRMREIDPELRISNLTELVPFRAAQDYARYVDGLRKAGLPE
jgi:hypothetical protein